MGKEVFVTTILSDQMIEAGTAILEYIDRSGWVVEDAFWLRESDEEVWRLVLASPGVSCTGAKPLYAAIQKVIAEVPAERWIVIVYPKIWTRV